MYFCISQGVFFFSVSFVTLVSLDVCIHLCAVLLFEVFIEHFFYTFAFLSVLILLLLFLNFCMCMCYLYHCWMWGSKIIFITSIFLYLTYMPILPQQWQKSHFRVCKFQLFKEKHLLILMMLPCMHGKKNVSVCFWRCQKHFIPLIIIINLSNLFPAIFVLPSIWLCEPSVREPDYHSARNATQSIIIK